MIRYAIQYFSNSFIPVLISIAIFVAMAGCVTIEDRIESADEENALAGAIAKYYVDDAGDESCSVAVVSHNGVTYANEGSANEHSLYRIASLSKLFFHPVVLELHEKGRINLDSPVTAYSKLSLPPEYGRVTLRDLLLNRSGLPREFLLYWEPYDTFKAITCGFAGIHIYSSFDTREDFESMTWRPWWRNAVDEHRDIYSNVGFALLGMTIEDALGKNVEQIMREEACTKLGLADTTYEPCGEMTNRLTRACAGHLPWIIRRKHDVPDHRLGNALRSTGGLFSSSHDCAKAFSGYWKIIDAQLAERDLSSFDDDDVFGLLRVRILPNGRRILYRSGMIYGGASFVGFDPTSRKILIILRNVTSWPDKRGFAAMEKLLGMKEQTTNVSR